MKKYKPVFEINTFQSNHHMWDNNQFNDVLFWNLTDFYLIELSI